MPALEKALAAVVKQSMMLHRLPGTRVAAAVAASMGVSL